MPTKQVLEKREGKESRQRDKTWEMVNYTNKRVHYTPQVSAQEKKMTRQNAQITHPSNKKPGKEKRNTNDKAKCTKFMLNIRENDKNGP